VIDEFDALLTSAATDMDGNCPGSCHPAGSPTPRMIKVDVDYDSHFPAQAVCQPGTVTAIG
jgi:hypothetical protein